MCCRRWRSPTAARGRRPRPRRRSTTSGRSVASRPDCCPDTPYPHTFLDVVGFQRQLRPAQPRLRAQDDRGHHGRCPGLPADVAAERRRVGRRVRQHARRVRGRARCTFPVVVVSYDRTPGRASRLAARRAAACAVAFEASPLPRAEVTGAPLRRPILEVDRVADRAAAPTRARPPATTGSSSR